MRRSARRQARWTGSGAGRGSARPGRLCSPRPAARWCSRPPSLCPSSSPRQPSRRPIRRSRPVLAAPSSARAAERQPRPAAPRAGRRVQGTPIQQQQHSYSRRPRRGRPRRRTSGRPRSRSSAPAPAASSAPSSARQGRRARSRDCTSLAGTSDYGSTWYGVSAPIRAGPERQRRRQPASVRQPARRLGLRPGAVRDQPRRLALEAGGHRRPAGHRRRGCAPAAGLRHLRHLHGHRRRRTPRTARASRCTPRSPAARTWTPVTVPTGYEQLDLDRPASAQPGRLRRTHRLRAHPVRTRCSAGRCPAAPGGSLARRPARHGQASRARPPPGAAGAPPRRQFGSACAAAAPSAAQVSRAPRAELRPSTHRPMARAGSRAGSRDQPRPAPRRWRPRPPARRSWRRQRGSSTRPTAASTWRTAKRAAATGPAGGFSYVGMTNADPGRRGPGQLALGEIFVTRDGGKTWSPSPIAGERAGLSCP